MTWKPKNPPYIKFKKKVLANAAKVADFIYQIGEFPALRQPSKEIPLEKIKTPEMQKKFAYLKNSLTKYRDLTGYGRGIAAVQIGIPERFAVIYFSGQLLLIISPKITKESKQLLKYPEMCMSANPIIAPVVRPSWIEFDYYDEFGELQHWNTKADTQMEKMMNRVFQHEIDHLDGFINIDRVASPKELILESDPTFYTTANFEEVTK
jgi:peptide deformylase